MPYDLPRIPLPTDATSADLARLPAAIRRQALFSARLNKLGPLVQIGGDLKGILDGDKSASEARRDIRQALAEAGYRPPDGREGGLLDHASRARLDLILQQNVRAARGYGKWAADMDPDRLDLWPAQELVRVMARKNPRGTWKQRWEAAGGQIHGGRMIALKTSPVWVNLSRFGQPYPPYDYGSGMGVVDVGRDEAEKLGLISETESITPDPIPFPDMAEARLPDLGAMPALRDAVLKVFGDGAAFRDGVLSLAPARELPAAGDAAELGLGRLAERTVTPAPATMPHTEAVAMIERGDAVARDPDGRLARITAKTIDHWSGKPRERVRRLSRMRQAFAAVQEPQEMWERNGKRYYFRSFADDVKPRSMLVVVGDDGDVKTWVPVDHAAKYADRNRSGVLQVKEGA